jgi:hypothetical protein
MAVTELDVRRRAPYEEGRAFGAAGAYERVDGVARFAVDPDLVENAGITDLGFAARGPDGRVRFEADFCVLRSADPARASGSLLFHVANRGRQASVPFSALSVPPSLEISERIEPGDGFLLGRGWTVAWCGWQWDVERQPGLVGLAAPEARLPEAERDGQVLVQFQPHLPSKRHGLDHWPLDPPPELSPRLHRPYRPADPDDPRAVLTVRDVPDGPAVELPRGSWRFEGGAISLAGGFEAGRIYDVRYRPRECPVVGTGMLAVRDFVACLRHGAGAELARADHAFAFGVSQSGRFLRELLWNALNRDESGQLVFDGVLVHVAGARRGEFNQRYGQPSVQHAPSAGHLPPFADGALLARQRERGGVPRVFTVNTSSEYWRSEASLVHAGAGADVEPPAGVRAYLFAGCQHVSGVLPPATMSATSPWVEPANPLTTVDYTPLLRAAIVNLERWAVAGVEPPASAVPRIADGTAVGRADVLRRFAGTGAALPRADRLPTLHRLDLGERAGEGILRLPAVVGEPYDCLVSDVDDSLNEVAGIRLPDLTVPLASHTGWNPRGASSGGEGQLIDMLGSSIALSAEEIARRYASREEYCRLVRREAERMVLARNLLAEDVDAVVARAGVAWDAFTRATP